MSVRVTEQNRKATERKKNEEKTEKEKLLFITSFGDLVRNMRVRRMEWARVKCVCVSFPCIVRYYYVCFGFWDNLHLANTIPFNRLEFSPICSHHFPPGNRRKWKQNCIFYLMRFFFAFNSLSVFLFVRVGSFGSPFCGCVMPLLLWLYRHLTPRRATSRRATSRQSNSYVNKDYFAVCEHSEQKKKKWWRENFAWSGFTLRTKKWNVLCDDDFIIITFAFTVAAAPLTKTKKGKTLKWRWNSKAFKIPRLVGCVCMSA